MSSANNVRLQTTGYNSKLSLNESKIPIAQAIIEGFVLLLKCVWFLLGALVKLFLPVNEKSVKGSVTVITGAGHGIGRELAYQYACKGATVVCIDVNKQGNEETVQEISRLGYPKAHSYVCDVTNRQEVFALAKRIQDEIGDVSILINNAGILHSVSVLNSSPEMIERTLKVNTMSHFWTVQAFLPRMLELNHGHIVAISSMCGMVGLKYLGVYSASKFAVRGFMESLRNELKELPNCQVKLTTILPHMVDTGMCKKPSMRIPSLFPMVVPIEAAKHIIWAQCRDLWESSIPSSVYAVNTFIRLLPVAVGDAIFDYLDIHVKPD